MGTGPGRDGLEHWRHCREHAAGAGQGHGGPRGLGIWSQSEQCGTLVLLPQHTCLPFPAVPHGHPCLVLQAQCSCSLLQEAFPDCSPQSCLWFMGWIVCVSVPVLESKLSGARSCVRSAQRRIPIPSRRRRRLLPCLVCRAGFEPRPVSVQGSCLHRGGRRWLQGLLEWGRWALWPPARAQGSWQTLQKVGWGVGPQPVASRGVMAR